jgi:hypothetical protein
MTPNDQELEERYTRLLRASFQEFAIDYRTRIGRPMTAREWALAKLAHCAGWVEGFDAAGRLLVDAEAR